MCCALANWSPHTRTTTITVLGPDGFAAGIKKGSAFYFLGTEMNNPLGSQKRRIRGRERKARYVFSETGMGG